MKFKFKIQRYQTEAVQAVVDVFAGQPSKSQTSYRRDLGRSATNTQLDDVFLGYRNADVEVSDYQLLENVRKQQANGNIPQSGVLVATNGLGACSLDVEMETGTGKTYVYIKTMFELNKCYGWNKFIVVVPSIAIREGINKSFQMLEDHFMEQYGKKAHFFVYSSGDLHQIDSYSSSASINVMIINAQAFNTSLKEGANNKESRIIYSVRDDFGSRRPIDVIAANRPIIIMDEPQKMEGKATQNALKNFKPLFVLNYSATHKTSHNCVYALDALDAYRQRLVKKIQVKGITVQNLLGNQSYIYFDSILLYPNKAPEVKLEIEVKGVTGMRRQICKFAHGDSLLDASKLQAYNGFVITGIDPISNRVDFLNGESIYKGEVKGDVSEKYIQRLQLRETIKSHFEKEEMLFRNGIKTLSLFFIDEVANYKSYDADGNEVHGELWDVFEDEYRHYLNENLSLFDDEYQRYLRRFSVEDVHNGYFSIDKKGHAQNSKEKDSEENRPAYDLILKDKERLLSFEEPTRFIFSHSALREGWDNPNVFQICTLRHANSAIAKRQEVGRGLRICVNQDGVRMDKELLGDAVHDINRLTVIANESYASFAAQLQESIHDDMRERPKLATVDYFEGLTVIAADEAHTFNQMEAAAIVNYLYENDYIDANGNILQAYHDALRDGTLAPMGKTLSGMEESVHKVVKGIFDPSALDGMIENANAAADAVNDHLNNNAAKDEFKRLWSEINHRYVYSVSYDSEELIRKAVDSINRNLRVTKLRYVVTTGEQERDGVDFTDAKSTRSQEMRDVSTSTVPYDLVGEIARGATLTRRTVVRILRKINTSRLLLFKNNPEEFIREVIRLIKDEKATMIVEHISYNQIEQKYDTSIFTKEKNRQSIGRAYPAQKHILDYVFTDSDKERDFAKALDHAEEVCVYAKLPRSSFHIPTPVGHYSPDWAIAFNDNMGVKHVFFIAETKGSMDSMQLKGAEKAKIDCAKKLFNSISTSKVRYHEVTDYEQLLNVVNSLQ